MNEVVATSAQASPATHLLYGVRRVCAAWCIPRATFYAQRRRGATIPPATVATTPRVRRGPQTSDLLREVEAAAAARVEVPDTLPAEWAVPGVDRTPDVGTPPAA